MGRFKEAMLRNLVTSLIEHERVVTTFAKAKTVQRWAERLVTYAKKPQKDHGEDLVRRITRTPQATAKVMHVLGPRYQFRQGGYTRVLQLSKPRQGDGAPMAVVEYVDRPGEIRAARPPTHFQKMTLDQVMQQLGLDDEEDEAEAEEENNEEEGASVKAVAAAVEETVAAAVEETAAAATDDSALVEDGKEEKEAQEEEEGQHDGEKSSQAEDESSSSAGEEDEKRSDADDETKR